jgi:hypothetical protein
MMTGRGEFGPLKKSGDAGHQWLTSVIFGTWEVLEKRMQRRNGDRDVYRPDHTLFSSGEGHPALLTG